MPCFVQLNYGSPKASPKIKNNSYGGRRGKSNQRSSAVENALRLASTEPGRPHSAGLAFARPTAYKMSGGRSCGPVNVLSRAAMTSRDTDKHGTDKHGTDKDRTDKELARRLRALAEKLSQGLALPAGLAGRMARALDGWERALEAPRATVAEEPRAAPAEEPQGISAAAGERIRIWGDGSCAPNPGAGGWGAIVEVGGKREELSGGAPDSTNNIMEMTAAIEALRHTPPGAEVEVITDSQYLKNGITRWIHAWKRKGWRKADGQPVLNQGLWRELDGLVEARRVSWSWIRGHTGHPENERCDELARQGRLSVSQS